MSLISQLLFPGMFGAEMFDGDPHMPLHAQEAAHVVNAVEKRRSEFAQGRSCARTALTHMGIHDAIIDRGADGAPLWPQGIVGSITHTDGYACAVVSDRFQAIGVDAEVVGRVSDDLLRRLFDDEECARLMAMDAIERGVAATLGFSAKESCFKAFGARFHDVHLEWDDGIFRTERGDGRFLVAGDLALTLIAL